MTKRKGECVADYYDRLVLGDKKFDERQRSVEADLDRQRRDQEAVNKKTWGMGINE